ncbi:MAG: condensation domain-containing protein [Chloroflexota bacterium]
MSTFEFLVELKSKGIDISLNGEKLKLNAPKGTLTPDLKEELMARKAEIVQFLQRAEQVGDQAEVIKIEPVDRTGILPLSPAQERVWSLYQLDPTSTVLNVPVVWRLNGRLDTHALSKALQTIIMRHENLRSIFTEQDGKPQVTICSAHTASLNVVNLQELPEPEREAARLIEEETSKRPFAITQAPPYRANLYCLNDSEAILLINFHQIIFDWGAFDALLNEAVILYNAILKGESPDLPDLTFQYVDFAHWQQSRLQGDRFDTLNSYWQAKLAKPYHLLHLPVDGQGTAENAPVKFSLDADTTEALKTLSRKHGTTMFTMMLALYKIVLSAYSPNDDVAVFTTTGQDRTELKNLIGLFANLNVLRTDLAGNPNFSTIVERVKETTLGMISHQEFPIEQVLEHLIWKSNAAHSNIFQTVFIYQVSHPAEISFDGVESELVATGDHLGGFDWRFFLDEYEGEIFGDVEFNPERYSPETIATLVQNFEGLVQQVIQSSDLPLDALRSPEKVLLNEETAVNQYVAPSDEIEQKLVELWQDALNLPQVGITDNFFALGGHSLLAAQLFHKIKVQMGKNLPLALLINAPTIKEMATFMRDGDGDKPWDSLVSIQAQGEATPLFLIHGAGGNVLLYRDLAKHLGPNQPVYGLQAQGLDGQGNYLTDFKEMATLYLKEIRAIQPYGPYHLGGYCLGGALAYEMAQQLETVGEKTNIVAMFESYNVHAYEVEYTGLNKLIYKVQNVWFHAENLLRLSFKDMMAFFTEKASVELFRLRQRLSRSGNGDNEEMIHVILDDINDAAHEAYYPEQYNGRVAIYRPRKDFIGMNDPNYGWRDLVPNSLDVHQLDVNPKGMMVEPYVQQLAANLSQYLQQEVQVKVGD